VFINAVTSALLLAEIHTLAYDFKFSALLNRGRNCSNFVRLVDAFKPSHNCRPTFLLKH
jgi:hypothetical protein